MEKSKERRVINNNNGGVGAKAMVMKRRMQGLKKKLREFTCLCEVDTLMIAYNGSNGEVIDTWPENQLELNRVINRYISVDKAERDKRAINHVDHNNGRCEDDMKNVIYGGDEKKLREMVSSLNNKLDKVKKLADSRSEKDRLQNIVRYDDNAVVNDGVPPAYYCHGEPLQSIKASCQAWSTSNTSNPNLVLQPEPIFIESMVPETVMPCDDQLWEELRDYGYYTQH